MAVPANDARSNVIELPGMDQNEREFIALLDLLERAGVESILEVGVFQGGTIARFARRFPYATIVGIDPEAGAGGRRA